MTDTHPDGLEEALRDFHDSVNLTAGQLRDWLGTEESRSVGDTSHDPGDDSESTGHRMGRRIVDLLGTATGDYSADDVAAMRTVVGYVHRHLAQRPAKEDIGTSRWRYSLMNWGHDPLKD